MKQKFIMCRHCGNIVAVMEDSGVPMECCGEEMMEIIPGRTDGAEEKHVPVCRIENDKVYVTVGETEHPMEKEHYIQWIVIETSNGSQMTVLKPGDKPAACFALCDGDKVEAVYEYCNIHQLWKAEI